MQKRRGLRKEGRLNEVECVRIFRRGKEKKHEKYVGGVSRMRLYVLGERFHSDLKLNWKRKIGKNRTEIVNGWKVWQT
jgi:hypothetical protein